MHFNNTKKGCFLRLNVNRKNQNYGWENNSFSIKREIFHYFSSNLILFRGLSKGKMCRLNHTKFLFWGVFFFLNCFKMVMQVYTLKTWVAPVGQILSKLIIKAVSCEDHHIGHKIVQISELYLSEALCYQRSCHPLQYPPHHCHPQFYHSCLCHPS